MEENNPFEDDFFFSFKINNSIRIDLWDSVSGISFQNLKEEQEASASVP